MSIVTTLSEPITKLSSIVTLVRKTTFPQNQTLLTTIICFSESKPSFLVFASIMLL